MNDAPLKPRTIHDSPTAALSDYIAFEDAAKALYDAEVVIAHLLFTAQAAGEKLYGRFPVGEVAKRAKMSRGNVYHALTYKRVARFSSIYAIAKSARRVAAERIRLGLTELPHDRPPTAVRHRKPRAAPRHDPVDAAARSAILATFLLESA